MTRISSLLVAASLAILPISAFAQQTATPAKTTAPTDITTAAPTAPVSDKTATTTTVTQSAKPDVKAPNGGVKTEMHGMNTVTAPHHAKANVPAKTAEPTKS